MTSYSNLIRRTYISVCAAGVDPVRLGHTATRLFWFIGRWREYSRKNTYPTFRSRLSDLCLCLSDVADSAGHVSGHYFHQDLYVARKIFISCPEKHVDIGSRLDGFISHLLTFRNVDVIDIRPLNSEVRGLCFIQSDATTLANFENDSVLSLSSLHAAEHFGLGRYGDPIDPEACFKFMASLERVLAPGGRLYFSTPLGRERLEFNAHRVFAPSTILSAFPKLKLVSFSHVGDDGKFYSDTCPEDVETADYSCGIFEFTK
jgi:SAM-dependent methyltransferase